LRIAAREQAFALIAAAAIVIVAYPGVALAGGSLAPSNLNVVVDRSVSPPIEPGMFGPYQFYGMQDLGAPLWQLEPATRYIANAIEERANPSWNPYSASGTPALATLADIKSSPFALLTGAFGASPTAYTFVLLGFLVLGAFFIIDFINRDLGLSRFIAILGGVVFVLNGFAVSYLVSQVAAPYFLFPFVLVTLFRYLEAPTTSRLALAGLAHAALFITTFFPVVACTVVAVHVLAWTAIDSRADEPHRPWTRRFGIHLGVALLGASLAAIVLMPIASQLSAGADISAYQSRNLPNRSPWLIYGLGARFHLWAAFDWSDYPARIARPVWTMYAGLAVLLTLAAGLRRGSRFQQLYIASWALVVSGVVLHIDIPWLGLLGDLPLLRIVRADYWAALIAIGLVILIPLSLHHISERGVRYTTLLAGAGMLAFAYLAGYAYLRDDLIDGTGWRVLGILSAIVIGTAVILGFARFAPAWAVWAAGGLIALELLFSVNHLWPPRTDVAGDPPSYVTFLTSERGEGRILNAGRTGAYPEWGSALGIEQLGTLNIGQDETYTDWFVSYVNPKRFFLQVGRDLEANPEADLDYAALDQLSVRFFVVEERMKTYVSAIATRYPEVLFDEAARIHVFENEAAFPTAYLAPTVRLTADPLAYATTTAVALTTDERFHRGAIEAGVADDNPTSLTLHGPAPRIVERAATRLVVEVETDAPSVLVVTDKWDRNWRATVNGNSAPIGRVNGPVRGVVVPSGRSRVEMTYRDDAMRLGALVSFLSVAGLIALAGHAALAKRRSSESGESAPMEHQESGAGRAEPNQ
jgi:hypothetical protein